MDILLLPKRTIFSFPPLQAFTTNFLLPDLARRGELHFILDLSIAISWSVLSLSSCWKQRSYPCPQLASSSAQSWLVLTCSGTQPSCGASSGRDSFVLGS